MTPRRVKRCVESSSEIAGVLARLYLFARAPENEARRFHGAWIVAASRELVDRRQVTQPHGLKGYS